MHKVEKLTKEEKIKAYMKLPKKELVNMLIECNDLMENTGCSLCFGTGFYTYGGSFGGPVHTERCVCQITNNSEK